MMAARVSVRDLMDRMNQGQALLILDVREGFCESDHMIPGAIHVDARHLKPDLFKLPRDAEIVVYDNSAHNETALKVAEALVNAGFKAEALLGGWDNWKKAGYPTSEREELMLRDSQAAMSATADAVKEETPVERGQEALKETGEAVGKMAGELAQSAGETAREARTGVLDVAQRAVNLVVSLFRR